MTYSKLYDTLIDLIDEVIGDSNPCKFEDGLCGKEREVIKEGNKGNPYCCCRDNYSYEEGDDQRFCNHFKENVGCTVKAISCKSWFCGYAKRSLTEIQKTLLSKIEVVADSHNIYYVRDSKEQALHNKREGDIIDIIKFEIIEDKLFYYTNDKKVEQGNYY